MTFAAIPLSRWFFGLRTWVSMVLALYVAFWLQLDGASSAATCAGILALPTRGQAVDKAIYRFAGTALGVAASIVIAGLFNGLAVPFLLAVAAWLALCVFAADMLDGNRAYAAVLSGYTVSIAALVNIDDPTSTFSSGINRGAAITLGIAATAVVSDLLGAPDLLPGLLERLRNMQGEVRTFVLRTVERGAVSPGDTVGLFGKVSALRADAITLASESIGGRSRSAAARRAIAEMVREMRAAGILASTLAPADEEGAAWHANLASAFSDAGAADALIRHAERTIATDGAGMPQLIAARGAEALLLRDRAIARAIDGTAGGEGPTRGPGLPTYHSRRNAARNALRTFLTVLLVGAHIAISGWPATSGILATVSILSCLSATAPDARGFSIGMLVGMPMVVVVVGVTEFLVLDGVDSYPLLAIALLPIVLAGGLLTTASKPLLKSLGFTLTVFTPVLLAPTNPQSYNPQNFLTQSLFNVTAAAVMFVAATTLLPTDDRRRRGWILGAIRRELREASTGRQLGGLTDEEASYRAADRLAQLGNLHYADDRDRGAVLAHALRLAEITFAIRWLQVALDGREDAATAEARAALAALDPARLGAAGTRLRRADTGLWVGAGALRAAALLDRYADDVAQARAAP